MRLMKPTSLFIMNLHRVRRRSSPSGTVTDIMPALCNVDYASMELLHAKLVRTTTCVNGCRCDYTICGDQDPYVKEHPEYRDEAGFRKNK